MTQSSLIVRSRVFVRNVATNWLALAAEVAIAFFLTPIIVRSLGLVAYGTWSVLNSVVGYMGLVDLGIRGSVGRFLNAYLGRRDTQRMAEVVSTSLAFLGAMSALAFVVSFAIAAYFEHLFPKTPPELLGEVRIVLPLMAVGLWLAFYGSVFRTVLAALDRFDVINAVALVALAGRAVATVWVLSRGGGLLGLVAVTLVAGLATAVAYARLAQRMQPELRFRRVHVSRERFVEMWRFGLVAFVTRSASTLATQAAPVIAMTFMGPAAVGIYSIATQLTQSCRRLVEQIGEAIYPSVMRVGGVGDRGGLRTLFRRYARVSFLVAGLLYLGVFTFSPQFIRLWVGPSFDAAVPVVRILVAADLIALLTSTGALTLFSLGKLKLSLAVSAFEAVGIVVLSILLVGPLGLGLPGLALGAFLPVALARGIAYPLLTAREIGMSYTAYVVSVGWRVALVAALSLLGFHWISATIGHGGWGVFMAGVLGATAAYAVIALPLFLTREDFRTALSALQRRR